MRKHCGSVLTRRSEQSKKNETLSEEAKRQRVDAIRDEVDQELTARRRADRDRRQAAQDRLDDQQELERKAVTNRIKTLEEGEKQFMETAKASAKKTGEADGQRITGRLCRAAAEGRSGHGYRCAEAKLKGWQKSQQTSVLNDLVGKEAARGAAVPLIANLGELTRILRSSR